jgi:hypothetical protein
MLQTVNLRTAVFAAAIGALCALAGRVQAQAPAPGPGQPQQLVAITPDLTGSYKCQPNPDPCLWPGASPSITQSGKVMQIKGDNGATADATLTSAATISAGGTFNSLGIIRPDHAIDWSDGTKWTKQ